MLHQVLLRTKLIPPRPQRHILPRPRVLCRLREALDYRVTILQAGTGYGKSTSLVELAGLGIPLFWYTVAEGDVDPSLLPFSSNTGREFGYESLAYTPESLHDAAVITQRRGRGRLPVYEISPCDLFHIGRGSQVDRCFGTLCR